MEKVTNSYLKKTKKTVTNYFFSLDIMSNDNELLLKNNFSNSNITLSSICHDIYWKLNDKSERL